MTDMNQEDKDLDDIFHGEPKPLHPDTIYTVYGKPNVYPAPKNETPKVEQKPIEEQWSPEKPNPNWMDKVKSCAKWVWLFGGLSILVFYWKEAGLMAESIAVPSIAVCTALAGWGVGINCARGNR